MNDPNRWHTSDRFDEDAIFADIIAHLNDDEAEPERAAGPSAKDAPTDHETTDETTAHGADDATDHPLADATDHPPDDANRSPLFGPTVLPAPDDQPDVPTSQVWRAHEVDNEYEEHFEPPPIAPLPVGDLQFWGIIAGMGGGPLLLLYLVFFNRDAGSYWLISAIAMSVGGFALLVSRLPRHHEDDDDGARL